MGQRRRSNENPKPKAKAFWDVRSVLPSVRSVIESSSSSLRIPFLPFPYNFGTQNGLFLGVGATFNSQQQTYLGKFGTSKTENNETKMLRVDLDQL